MCSIAPHCYEVGLAQRHRRAHDWSVVIGNGLGCRGRWRRHRSSLRRRRRSCERRGRISRHVSARHARFRFASRWRGRSSRRGRSSACARIDRLDLSCRLGRGRFRHLAHHLLLSGLQLGDVGLELLDLLRHRGEVARHRLHRLRDVGLCCRGRGGGNLNGRRRSGLFGRSLHHGLIDRWIRCGLLRGRRGLRGDDRRGLRCGRQQRRQCRGPFGEHLFGGIAVFIPGDGGGDASSCK